MKWKRNARVRESGGAAVLTCCYSDTSWSLQRIKLFKNCSSLLKAIQLELCTHYHSCSLVFLSSYFTHGMTNKVISIFYNTTKQ